MGLVVNLLISFLVLLVIVLGILLHRALKIIVRLKCSLDIADVANSLLLEKYAKLIKECDELITKFNNSK